MRRLECFTTPVVVADAAAALPYPPVDFGVVSADWSDNSIGAVPEFDLDIWALETLSLTDAEVFGGILRAFVYADDTVTFDNTTDYVELTDHGLETGDGPLFLDTAGGTSPAELTDGDPYWVIKVDANNFQLAATFADAVAGTAVEFDDDGDGTTTISDSADTKRIYWHSFGLLQDDISLDETRAFSVRCSHRPSVAAYALIGTLSAGAVTVTVTPVQDR